MKKIIAIILISLSYCFTGCASKNVLNERYPSLVKALLIGVDRATLEGDFSKGGFTKIKELFSTTEWQKHKNRVLERLNELKGTFSETKIISSLLFEAYKNLPDNRKIFNFYRIENLSFTKIPYFEEVKKGFIDRSFKLIKNKLQGNLILEIRPIRLTYIESKKKMKFKLKLKLFLFDVNTNKITWTDEISVKSKIESAFYKEAKLKPGENPTPGFRKIKVKFIIENYKKGIARLAKKVVPEILKVISRKIRE